MDPPDETLELSGEPLRRLIAAATERLLAHLETLPSQPVLDVEGSERVAREVPRPLPERGRPAEEVLDELFGGWIQKGFHTASPGYLAYIPGGGLPHAAVADLIAGIVNRYVGVWAAAPALAQLEASVVRWFCDIVGYPAGSGGFLTTGGSLANWSALVTARRVRLGDDFGRATIYGSDQTHYSVVKAAVLAGFAAERVRRLPSDGAFRLRPDALADAVARDRRGGLEPFLVCANAGTTSTGAVDDLPAVAEIARRERLWLHVDGAYGGFFALTQRGRSILAGLEQADSITLDPHKALFLPYGNGSLLVREAEHLGRAFRMDADYLPGMQEDPELVDFCAVSPELSRDFRGLRVWLPFSLCGAGAFRRALDEKLDLARSAARELALVPGVEIVAEPQLTVVAFRLRGEEEGQAAERLNRRFLERIHAGGRVFLTPTVLGGRFVLRLCVLSFRTHAEHIDAALEDVRRAAAEVLAERAAAPNAYPSRGGPGSG